MSTDRQTRTTQASTKKAEECSRKQPNVDKEISVKDFQMLQKTVTELKQKLSNYDTFTTDFKHVKSLLDDDESGISNALKYVSEQSQSNYDDIYYTRSENAELHKEVELLRATLIKMDRKMISLEREVTDLRSRSMRDNIMIHNYAYSRGENLAQSVPSVIKKTLGVDVDFVGIHRNSVKGSVNSRPVTITAKLVDRNKKDELLQAQKSKKLARVTLPFFITAQEPPSVVESRKRLYAISDSQRKQNIRSKVEKGHVVMPNGDLYKDPVPKLDTSDILQLESEEVAALEDLPVMSTDPTKIKGSEIFATGTKIDSIKEATNLYKKVCVDPYSAAADHRIFVYRFVDSNGKTQESFWDDGEHGAGRRLLQCMQTNKIQNLGVVITRWSGSARLGPDRFRIMEEHLCELASSVDES